MRLVVNSKQTTNNEINKQLKTQMSNELQSDVSSVRKTGPCDQVGFRQWVQQWSCTVYMCYSETTVVRLLLMEGGISFRLQIVAQV